MRTLTTSVGLFFLCLIAFQLVQAQVPPPVARRATNVSAIAFQANWFEVGGILSYRLDVSTDPEFRTLLSGYNNRTVSGASEPVLVYVTQKRFYYRVRAVNASGLVSQNSNTIVVTELGHNYIRTTEMLIAGKTTSGQVDNARLGERLVQVDYFDDLGRKDQSIQVERSPALNDVIQPFAYDAMGREAKRYLPYVFSSKGLYKPDALGADDGNAATPPAAYTTGKQFAFYQTGGAVAIAQDEAPYSETIFEPNPLDRVFALGAPGKAFQPNVQSTYASPVATDHSIKHSYEYNGENEVLLWTYVAPGPNSPKAMGRVEASTGSVRRYYGVNQLERARVKDEHHNEVVVYKDKKGREVLKRVQVLAGNVALNDENYASTYYIYDDFGDLVCVIPPQAAKLMTQTTSQYFGKTEAEKEDFLKRWTFRYRYDARRRMIQKQVPGAGQVYTIYDKRDRLVLSQDSVQRLSNEWFFTKYDVLDRVVGSGIWQAAAVFDPISMQDEVTKYYNELGANGGRWFESYVGAVAGNMHGYDNLSFPKVANADKYLSIKYYDNYTFKGLLYSTAFDFKGEEIPADVAKGYPGQVTAENTAVKGLLTGTKTRALDAGSFQKSVFYYDEKYRVVQQIDDNVKGHTVTTNVYDFVGKVLRTKSSLHIGQPAVWTNVVDAQVQGDVLVSTGSSNWAQGATSVQLLPANADGWVEITVIDDLPFMIGMGDQYVNSHYNYIDYAWFLSATSISVRESGTLKGSTSNAFPGDVLRVERVDNTVYYKRNGIVLYTSAVASTTSLMMYVSFYNNGSKIAQARVSNTFNNSASAVAASSFGKRLVYDVGARLVDTWHTLNNGPEILLSHYTYNELGQLIDKKLHSTVAAASDAKQSIDYRYNIRGWLSSINNTALAVDAVNDDADDLFGMNLAYNDDLGLGGTVVPQYNGNISAVTWSNSQGLGPVKAMAYGYSYDPMNRLSAAVHRQAPTLSAWTAGQYHENGLTYDFNGNIQTLQRTGAGGAVIDALTYNYGTASSNRLQYVTDAAPVNDRGKGFNDGSTTGNDYTYDGNGNMLTDKNKGITSAILYNHLNLPRKVVRGTDNICYLYDAAGVKQAQLVTYGLQQKLTEYVGPWIFENNRLQFLQHDEGRTVLTHKELIFTHSGDGTADVVAEPNITLSNETIQGESYLKVSGAAGTTLLKSGITSIGGAFAVAENDRYLFRVKGYWTGSVGASLYVKANSTEDLLWRSAHLPRGASNEAWVENLIVIPANVSQISLGLLFNNATSGQEQFFVNEMELIKLDDAVPEYQYHLKDHLGNVRLTFTTKEEVEESVATLEVSSREDEQDKFLRYQEARKVESALFDHTNGDKEGYAQRLAGGQYEKYGLGKTFSVMPGDVVRMEVFAKYLEPEESKRKPNLNLLLPQIIATAILPSGNAGVDVVAKTDGETAFPFAGLNGTDESEGGGPRAFLNWLVYDRDFKFISGGYTRMSGIACEQGQDVEHEELKGQVRIAEPGYVYVYVSNEEPVAPREVYFDDLRVQIVKAQVIQMDDYYPFGLTFNSYRRENTIGNLWKFQGQEHIDPLNLEWDSFKWRNHQPDIGRFFNVDPLAKEYSHNSPYAFSENKITSHVELEGLEAWDIKALWNEEHKGQFQDYARSKSKELFESGENFICEDFVLEILIDFASENALPIDIQNGAGSFDASSKEFASVDDYKMAVMRTTGSLDLDQHGNTTEVPLSDVRRGDLLVNRYDDNVVYHVQQVTSVKGDNVTIYQGNQRGLSSNPSSPLYGGTDVQRGSWNRKEDVYKREGGQKKPDYSKKENVQGRRWNFDKFNRTSTKNEPGPRKGTKFKDY